MCLALLPAFCLLKVGKPCQLASTFYLTTGNEFLIFYFTNELLSSRSIQWCNKTGQLQSSRGRDRLRKETFWEMLATLKIYFVPLLVDFLTVWSLFWSIFPFLSCQKPCQNVTTTCQTCQKASFFELPVIPRGGQEAEGFEYVSVLSRPKFLLSHIPVSSQFQILPPPSHLMKWKISDTSRIAPQGRQKFAQNSPFIRLIKRVIFPTNFNTRRRREIFTRKSLQLRCYLS